MDVPGETGATDDKGVALRLGRKNGRESSRRRGGGVKMARIESLLTKINTILSLLIVE